MGEKINEGMKKTTGVHEPQPRACLLSLHPQWERRIEGGKRENWVVAYKGDEKNTFGKRGKK